MEWHNSITDFFKPVDTFLMAYLAPCIVYGKTAHRLEKGDPQTTGYEMVNSDCIKYQVLCCLAGRLQRKQRGRIRETYNLSGDECNDYLLSCLCRPCDLIQQDKEVAYHAGHADALKDDVTVVQVQPNKQEAGMNYAAPA